MRERGALLFSVSFILLISFLGLTLLTFSITHTKIIRARGKKIRETRGLYNQLYLLLHESKKKICTSDLSLFEDPVTDFFNSKNFPLINNKDFKLTRKFNFNSVKKQDYMIHKGSLDITALSKNSGYKFANENIFNLLSGNIPISLIPLFINSDIELQENKSRDSGKINAGTLFTAILKENEVLINVTDYLSDLFDLNSKSLNWTNIREKLGLNICEKELENGIYLFISEMQIKTILIQGDVESILFFTNSEKQGIRIDTEKELFEIEYIPGENYFLLENSEYETSLNFSENIVINGSVRSMSQSGMYAFTEKTSLKVTILGNLNINSSLLKAGQRNHESNNRIPILIRLLRSPFSAELEDQRITIETADNSIICGSIMIQGNFLNKSNALLLKGTLYSEKIRNSGSMKISPVFGNESCGKYFHLVNYNYVSDFHINYIEEVFDE